MFQSYTTIHIPRAGVLTLRLPRELYRKRLAITISEAENEPASGHPNAELLDILLSAPTLSDEELHGFKEAREYFNEWRQP